MSRMRITEKEQLIRILSDKINRAVEAIKAKHKDELDSVISVATEEVNTSLGLEQLVQEYKRLTDEKNAVENAAVKRVKELKPGIWCGDMSGVRAFIQDSIKKRTSELQRELPSMQKVVRMEAELLNMQETVWLMTGDEDVVALFKRINSLIDEA